MLGKNRSSDGTLSSEVSAPTGGITIIGEHVSIVGDIRGKEDLVIEGSVKGIIDLENCRITVGREGKVEAEIGAQNVTIMGHMQGNIKALDKVEITKEAEFNGEIKAKRISVEDGAYLKAAIELDRESQESAQSGGKPSIQVANKPEEEEEPISVAGGGNKRK